MPLLTYSFPDFTANTLIQSAQVNAKYTDIKTLLNTTGLDDLNIQAAGITRATKLKAGTANYVVINAADGTMTEESALSPARGGLGINYTPSAGDALKVPRVNAAGTAFEIAAPADGAGTKIYVFNRSY